MLVIFDTSAAAYTPGGTRTYTNELAAALKRISGHDDIQVRTSDLPVWLQPHKTKLVRHKLKVAAWDTYYMQMLLPRRAALCSADLLHTPTMRVPLRARTPLVASVLDVIPLIYPQYFRLRDRLVLGLYFRATALRAQHVVTISEQSRSDIHRYLDVPFDHITVTYPGISPAFQPLPQDTTATVSAKYGMTRSYILCVGTLEPRKNLARVLAMYAKLKKQNAHIPELVIVGRRGWLEASIFETSKHLGIMDDIRFTGFVPDADLPALYSGAAAFVYPSLYEGFGIPPLEAMACGCPVITSNISSLPEVVGDAGLQVDPNDVDALAQAVAHVLENRSFADDLRDRGLKRASNFSWDRCGAGTIAAYEKVLQH